MKLSDVFLETTTVPRLEATTKSEAMAELVEVLRRTRRLSRPVADEVLTALERREEMGSTGIGRGIGIPHVKHASVKRIVGAFGRSVQGVEFQALDAAPVYLVFLLVSPQDDVTDHLHLLRKISALAQDADLRRFLRNAQSAAEIAEIMQEAGERTVL